MDGVAWWAAVYGVAQSGTRLKRFSSSSSSNVPLRMQDIYFFLTLNILFCFGINRLTMLWEFQVNSEETQPYIYMYPFSPKLPSHPGCSISLN